MSFTTLFTYFVCMYVHMCVHMCAWHTHRGQRTAVGVSVLPPSGSQGPQAGLQADGSAFPCEPSHRSYVMFLSSLSFVKWDEHRAYRIVLFMGI